MPCQKARNAGLIAGAACFFLTGFQWLEPFATYPDVDEVQGVAAQRVQAHQTDGQTSGQHPIRV